MPYANAHQTRPTVYLSRKAATAALFDYLRDCRARGETLRSDTRCIIKRYVGANGDRTRDQGHVVHVLHDDRRVTL